MGRASFNENWVPCDQCNAVNREIEGSLEYPVGLYATHIYYADHIYCGMRNVSVWCLFVHPSVYSVSYRPVHVLYASTPAPEATRRFSMRPACVLCEMCEPDTLVYFINDF